MSAAVATPPAEAGPSNPSTLPPLADLVKRSVKRTRAIYTADIPSVDDGLARAHKIKLATKLAAEYKDVQTLPPILQSQQAGPAGPKRPAQANGGPAVGGAGPGVKLIGGPEAPSASTSAISPAS